MKKIHLLFSLPFLLSSLLYSQSDGKISGVVFTDYFYNAARDTGIANLRNVALPGQKDLNGFELRRAYLTYDYKISEDFSSRFRLEADSKALTQNNRIGVFVKDAFIRWKNILPGHDIILGIQPPPAYEISESYYGFRSLEKTIMDLRGAVSSRDFGLAVKGRIINNVNYWLLYGNNSAVSPETDKYKRLYAHISYQPIKEVTTTIYSDIRFNPQKTDPVTGSVLNNDIITSAVFVGYSDNANFSFGTEAFYRTIANEFSRNNIELPEDLNSLGVSVFGWVKIVDNVTATARYDLFDPGLNDELENDRRNFFLFGVSWRPVPKVSVIPNVMIETYDDLPERSIDASVTPRITFVYEF